MPAAATQSWSNPADVPVLRMRASFTTRTSQASRHPKTTESPSETLPKEPLRKGLAFRETRVHSSIGKLGQSTDEACETARHMGNSKKNKGSQGKQKRKTKLAETADKFVCYLKSVQSPEHEVEFFEQAFRDEFGRRPFSLREDFCGTFSVCCEWVKSRKKRTALGVDLCPETLEWGRDHNLSKLKKHAQNRITIIEQDVREQNDPQVDVLAAQNFSFWIFKTRQEVIEYFKVARANLKPEGIMVMDMMGGGDCLEEGQVDKRKIGKGKKAFQYEWEQAAFNPVNHDCSFYIHFKFSDGSKMKRAFEYHWRFWTLPEVREMLAEAGFSNSHVYWEIEDEDGEDTGEWERRDTAPSIPCWVNYLVAVK